ncbi:MAG: hypothetical protein HY282_10560 [Nitrospirae bacterium]|nr:hypothetical protein [Candidatus Manganitrophaceae bacterium]
MRFTDRDIADLLRAAEEIEKRLKQLMKKRSDESLSDEKLKWIREQMLDLEAIIRDIQHLVEDSQPSSGEKLKSKF